MSQPAFRTPQGVPVFMEVSHTLPVVDVDVIVMRGSLLDPRGKEGLTRLTARLMRRGPKGTSREVFDERLDALGATLTISVGHESMRIQGSVIRRNLEPFLRQIAAVAKRPGLRQKDFVRLKRTAEAELIQLRDHDGALAARAFRKTLFGRHAYARPVSGTLASVGKVELADVRAQHERLMRAPHLLIGMAGDVTPEDAERYVNASFSDLLGGSTRRPQAREPRMKSGRHVVLVDKPKRTQSQVYIGTLGLVVGDPERHAMIVGNTAFGGTFTARLMKEVRSKRGWSYGAYSKLGADRQREAWSMWTHPGADQLVDCVRLQLSLYEKWLDKGLTGAEVKRAKRYLIKSHPFDLETAGKRLEPKLHGYKHGLPDDWFDDYPQRVRALGRADVNDAVRGHLSRDDLSIAVLATATPELQDALRSSAGVRSLTVIPFDLL